MDFDRSTQAKSWLFSEASLAECREITMSLPAGDGQARVRKFASGFHVSTTGRHSVGDAANSSSYRSRTYPSRYVTADEQGTLLRFHAHQLSLLIGPKAVHRGLLRSSTVLATAIMCFRRFYLSNSVVDFKPRRMAAASALLAAKLEEKRIDIQLLQHATSVVYDRVRLAPPLCREELEPTSVEEIESAERDLLEGLNYELRFFHPNGAIRVLAADTASFLSQIEEELSNSGAEVEERNPCESAYCGRNSPRSISDDKEGYAYELQQKALSIAHNALMFSDAPFLYPPGKQAFAAIAIAMRDNNYGGIEKKRTDSPFLSDVMRMYLRVRFPQKGEAELRNFELQVTNIISLLDANADMNLNSLASSCTSPQIENEVAMQAKELRRVMEKASGLRELVETPEGESLRSAPRKRKTFHEAIVCPNDLDAFSLKVARVTPI